MSNAAEAKADENNNVCANCGVAEVDDIKLEDCDGCNLVKCCSDKCTENHREQHQEGCKKREAELHDDDDLFRQPDISHRGECPLCFLPMPIDAEKSSFYTCCSKLVCNGCVYADCKSNGGKNCPFCREPHLQESNKRIMKRVKVNDPAAMSEMGTKRYHGGDHDTAVQYWIRAAELGNLDAHYELGGMYWRGEGVEKDEEKHVYHWEKAAMGGHPKARHNLGCVEEETERAVKHLIIAANLGFEGSMKELWGHYSAGDITKEDLESTLRTHKAAIDAMKSPEREAAEAWQERQRGA
jgi:hypothetical protein